MSRRPTRTTPARDAERRALIMRDANSVREAVSDCRLSIASAMGAIRPRLDAQRARRVRENLIEALQRLEALETIVTGEGA